MLRDLSKNNKNYSFAELDVKDVLENPIAQLVKWLDFAEESEVEDYNAMIISTVGEEGKPSSRVVLLKSIMEEGLVFYTNYTSRKGNQISNNPNVSVVFFWPKLERQIRIEGITEKVSFGISDEYFNSRPLDSQMGAVVSPQSQIIPNREFLTERIDELKQSLENRKLIRPAFWGGYIIKPNLFEFWQGRANRLSDRIRYRIEKDNWIIERLAP
jgi:pyridoxamine 5'-phosphate oxidase